MRVAWLLGPLLFLAGVSLLLMAIARGEASLSLVVIFPVITATGLLGGIGILLMIVAFVLGFFLLPLRSSEPLPPPALGVLPTGSPPSSGKRWGGVVFLGPIPIVFGSSPRITRTMLLVAVALFLGLLLLTVLSLLAI